MQGPFDTFLVGGDMAEVCDIKFSNDGKSMLLTTTSNNIYVLDAYGGEKVCSSNWIVSFELYLLTACCFTFCVCLQIGSVYQRCLPFCCI